jgi:regulator of protease activity HflC (stomatin/prohibitin superfamily)
VSPRTLTRLLGGFAALFLVYLVGYVGLWQWMFCRVEVPPGYSLQLRYKGPFPFAIVRRVNQAAEGTLVDLDKSGRPAQIGILRTMPGPGRHFYSPLEYERKTVPDILIEPGEVGIVTSRVGKPLPAGAILADSEGFRGTWRRVLTPGRYRFNDYAYQVEKVPVTRCVGASPNVRKSEGDPTIIPPGYVGVVTNKADNPKAGEAQGIQENVLQPGIYFLNPYEKQVDVVSVGFNETSLSVETVTPSPTDPRGERIGVSGATDPHYVPGKGIEFPSNDGFTIHMDYTAIWGVLPDQAPDVVRQFGTLKDVEDKVILPQIGSICRLYGSKRGSVDLLVGDKREEFQADTAEELERVLESKNLSLLFGLTRHIYVPAQVREPIQRKYIADEMKLTADQKQLTAQAQAALTEAKAKVTLEERRTMAETLKLVAETAATGEKQAKEIAAETERLIAETEAETAGIQAQITTTMGEAEAKKTELANQAEAELYSQYVASLGSPEAYNRYVFAESLPADLRLGVFYAGQGTFWTDLKGMEQTLLGKVVADSAAGTASPGDAAPATARRPMLPPAVPARAPASPRR